MSNHGVVEPGSPAEVTVAWDAGRRWVRGGRGAGERARSNKGITRYGAPRRGARQGITVHRCALGWTKEPTGEGRAGLQQTKSRPKKAHNDSSKRNALWGSPQGSYLQRSGAADPFTFRWPGKLGYDVALTRIRGRNPPRRSGRFSCANVFLVAWSAPCHGLGWRQCRHAQSSPTQLT